MKYLFSFFSILLLASPAVAGGGTAIDGTQLNLLWCIPFVGMLLSLGIIPAVAMSFWHKHDRSVAIFWTLALLCPLAVFFGPELALYASLETMLHHYIPFVILISALYTITGGVRLESRFSGTPMSNVILLTFGTIIASWVGTTGAAMLLIRPLLRSIEWRNHNKHVVVFFIFLVANIGGMLTPLGDPPLFLGFLEGVAFFWTTKFMWDEFLFVSTLVLIIFYAVDLYYYKREDGTPPKPSTEMDKHIHIEGKINFLFLAGVLGGVLLSGYWKPGIDFDIYGVHVELQNVVRDVLLFLMLLASFKFTRREVRDHNQFDWMPLKEVATIFIAIFITALPVIAILQSGENGDLAWIVKSVTNASGPIPAMYFWLTGLLSAFLDNAPTYLVFFHVAGGDPAALMGKYGHVLAAISSGAVFMGALSYIGNAPNMMVESIAKRRGIKMPTFFGYMTWSFTILIPVFLLATLVFFRT